MNFSSNEKLGQNRPSLLPTDNQEKFPAIKILSSLERSQQPMPVGKPIKRKLKLYALIGIIATLSMALFLYLNPPQNVLPHSETLVLSSNSTEASSEKFPASPDIDRSSVFHDINKLSTTSPYVSENDQSAAPSSALLVDDLSEKWEEKKLMGSEDRMTIKPSKIAVVASKPKTPAGKKTQDLSKQKALKASKEIPPLNAYEVENNRKMLMPTSAKKMSVQETKSRNKTEDSDIVLLSALLANTTKGSVLTSKNKHSENVMKPTDNKRFGVSSDNVDNVEQHSGDNTKKLLLQCQKLGGLEATLCQDRICLNAGEQKTSCPIPKG